MTHFERDCLKSRIVQHYINVANRQKKITVNHFLQEKVPRRTIYYIIKRYEESDTIVDKPRSGRPKKLTTGQLTRLKRLVNNKTDISLRRLSSKFKVSFKTISNQLKAMGIDYHKKREELQDIRINNFKKFQLRARRLYRLLSKDDFQLIMDDEKYFMFHNESVPSNRSFYTSNPNTVSPEIKFRRTQKFEPKVLV